MKYVYKVVAAALSIAVVAVCIFGSCFYFRIQSTALQALLTIGQALGNQTISDVMEGKDVAPDTMADVVSVKGIYDLVKGFGSDLFSGETSENDAIQTVITSASIMGILFALIIVCAIITAVLAIVCKNNRKPIYGSIVGIGLSIMFKFAFSSFADLFLDGTITVSSLTGAWWASLIAKVDALTLSTTFWAIPLLFVFVIIWTVLYNITLPEEEKAERKRMLGEYNEQ